MVSQRTEASRSEYYFVLLLFFLSGAAALIYEISWMRQIGLLFGHTAHAAAVVLSSFFAGMSIGYFLAGQFANRVRPLIGYAVAEALAAAWAALVPAILSGVTETRFVGWLSYQSPALQTGSRALFCFLLLLPATVALGATLPLIAEFCAKSGNVGRRFTMAYAVNTMGAVCGIMLASGYLLVTLGVTASSYLAAVVSAVCAVAAWLGERIIRRRTGADEEIAATAGDALSDMRAGQGGAMWLWVAVASGFITLALEVLYTRMFSLVFHNSVYTFATVLTVFLLALAAGTAAFSILVRWATPITITVVSSLVGPAGIGVSVFLFVHLTRLRYFSAGETFWEFLAAATGLVLVVVFPPVFSLGMILPAAWHAAGGIQRTAGKTVGRLTAANTISAAAGSIAATFLLPPVFGLWGSFAALAVAAVLIAVAAAWATTGRWPTVIATAVPLAIALFAALRPEAVISDPTGASNVAVIRRWQGAYGWIEVIERDSSSGQRERAVRQNLHYTHGSTGPAALREYRQAHLPMLLHPQPENVMFLGMGTGLTAGAATLHADTRRIVIAELVPEVIDAARMLADANYGVADHPNVEIIVDDARHSLLSRPEKFDVIVSDLFVPWESRTGYLYTVEHYQTARDRLKPGGIYCQWLALYQVGRNEFELIADSFATVFPQTTLWWGDRSRGYGIVGLIGSDRPIEMDLDAVAQRVEQLRVVARRTDPRLYPVGWLPQLFLGRWQIRNPAWLNTDEHPRVEFLAPVTHKDGRFPRLQYRALDDYHAEVLELLDKNGFSFRDATTPAVEQR